MARIIDDAYLRSFFSLGEGPEDQAELEDIRSRLVRIQYRNEEDICTIDGEPDGMFFLESGVALVLDRDGAQINVLHEGQYFGEYGVLAQQRRLSTVRSKGRTVVYKLGSEDMMEILRRHQELYGEFMKRVYGQVSHKHAQILSLSRMQRGVLRAPGNRAPLSKRHMLVQYGALALFILLAYLFVPVNSGFPAFLFPLGLMLAYVLITRRTLESLLVAGLLAALLVRRSGLVISFTDALIDTVGEADNVYTIVVLCLIGAMINLIEASGAVTAFKKVVDRRVRSRRGVLLGTLIIVAVTAIDDSLNLLCAAGSLRSAADEQRLPREDSAFLLSFLPTLLCTVFPFSMWAIFVVGSIPPECPEGAFGLFCRSIPLNFFSLIALAACVLFCFGLLPRSKTLRQARDRLKNGGELWPEGSERYIPSDEVQFWGSAWNLLLPMIVLAAATLGVRSLHDGAFTTDSAVGLVFTLVVMFILYCGQGLLSPEDFMEHLIRGIEDSILPIILYLLTMCFTGLLQQEALAVYVDRLVLFLGSFTRFIPATLFLLFSLLALALGSSWAMFVIGFPIAIQLAMRAGLPIALCVGAICAAGLAGESCCVFTSDSEDVGSTIGCNPAKVLAVRLPYSLIFSTAAFVLYLAVGVILG